MNFVTVSERAKEVKDLDLDHDNLPIDRALAIQWCMNSNLFQFKLELNKQPLIRRGIMSMVSSVYDPLGFFAPFIFKAKTILQELCKLRLGWDDKIPDDLAIRWNQWYQDMQKREEFKVNRCLKPYGFCPVSAQLLHFADASETDYGTVSYLRLENASKEHHCAFTMGKPRFAPLKQTTIPRLELIAATVAVRTNKMLETELDIPINDTVYWIDRMAVLRYIRNETSRFYTFVANRLAVIHEGSAMHEWRYINTKLNPADYTSRGISASEIVHGRWIQAPEFLWTSAVKWPATPPEISQETSNNDPEVKRVSVRAVKADEHELKPLEISDVMVVEKLIHYHTSWFTLRESVAWILKVLNELLRRIRQKHMNSDDQGALVGDNCTQNGVGHISFEDLKKAKVAILSYVQHQPFADELRALDEKQSHVKRSSRIRKLDPILDNDRLLYVGGRLHRSCMPAKSKHPIILPKDHHVSTLSLRRIHHNLIYSARNHMLAKLREQYWIVHAQSAIRKVVSKCVTCRRQRTKVEEQKMASLPMDRIIPDEPPFSRVGVDYFVPFEVKLK